MKQESTKRKRDEDDDEDIDKDDDVIFEEYKILSPSTKKISPRKKSKKKSIADDNVSPDKKAIKIKRHRPNLLTAESNLL